MFVVDKLNSDLMRKFRLYLDYSQEKMAELLGVNRVSYSRWESGTQEPESPKMLQLAFEALLNRKIAQEGKKHYQMLFSENSKKTAQILSDIDKMQKKRIGRKNM